MVSDMNGTRYQGIERAEIVAVLDLMRVKKKRREEVLMQLRMMEAAALVAMAGEDA